MNNTPSVVEAATRTTHRGRIVVIGGIVPLGIVAIATIAMISWMPELPEPIAIHWNASGADGFGPVWPMILMPLGLVLAFGIFAVAIAWKPTANGLLASSQKLVLVTSVWMSTLLSVGVGGSIFIQRGLADATEASGIGWFMLAGALGGLLLAVPAWFLLPATDPSPHAAIAPERLEVQATERVSWSRTVRLAPAALAIAVSALAVGVVALILTISQAPEGAAYALSALVVVTLLLLGTGYWRVSADRRGFIVRGVLGWPRVAIPLADIREAHVIDVNPTADFGGWGWRWGSDGRSGIIMRSGPAIQVTRSSGKNFVVTVDDAATGAAVLAALLPESR